jgi:hypothetical protein
MTNYESIASTQCTEDSRYEETVSFSTALMSLKMGEKICREGWNCKESFLFYVPDRSYFFSSLLTEVYLNKDVETLPWIAMKTSDNNIVPWTPSQSDILSNDWIITPKEN